MNTKLQKEKQKNNLKYKRELRKKPTVAEKIVKSELKRIQIKFVFQKGFYAVKGKIKGVHYIVDFYIPSLRLAIEVDGEYHNSRILKDRFRDNWIKEKREVNVLRVPNENAKNIVEIINNFLKNPPIKKNVNFNYWNKKYNASVPTYENIDGQTYKKFLIPSGL